MPPVSQNRRIRQILAPVFIAAIVAVGGIAGAAPAMAVETGPVTCLGMVNSLNFGGTQFAAVKNCSGWGGYWVRYQTVTDAVQGCIPLGTITIFDHSATYVGITNPIGGKWAASC